jgi:agmatine deiminase
MKKGRTSPFTSGSPAAEGFRMPAEWEKHKATWLTFPHDEAHWPGIFERIPRYWGIMAKELSAGEDVHILAHDENVRKRIEQVLEEAGARNDRVHIHIVPNNFAWMRDQGPIFIKNDRTHEVRMTHWIYNAWGNKWKHDLDARIPEHMERISGIKRIEVPMVLEGGSIDVNGRGTLLTTESCLLHPNRNPDLSKEEIEQYLMDYLGVTNILWLADGIEGDDTDGHVDDLARFVGPRTVVAVVEEDPRAENYKVLQENLQRLKAMKDQDGEQLEVIALPMPKPVMWEDVQLPASYANFYVGNRIVFLPTFNEHFHDERAVRWIEKCFPTRAVVAVKSVDLILGLGSFHCITQQEVEDF